MKPSSLITFAVLLALEILTSWTAEGTSTGKSKSGACPFRPHAMCLVYKPPECLNDWHCPMQQKCCPSYCSIKCMDPVAPSKQGTCLNDSGCLDSLKCCKGPCGNSCVEPLKDIFSPVQQD